MPSSSFIPRTLTPTCHLHQPHSSCLKEGEGGGGRRERRERESQNAPQIVTISDILVVLNLKRGEAGQEREGGRVRVKNPR